MNYLEELIKTVAILRSPQGCQWDREQTHQSIRQNMLEEAYEAAEAIDENNIEHIKEEHSDVSLVLNEIKEYYEICYSEDTLPRMTYKLDRTLKRIEEEIKNEKN